MNQTAERNSVAVSQDDGLLRHLDKLSEIGDEKKALTAACEEVEDEEDEHSYHPLR